ncbi:MAG: radical SAM protein [Dehalococcoidia bacterium]|nr:radical SAM protein [Dehalococcoidia bacterium]
MNDADITLLNLNMLYLKYFDKVDRELHLPLGPLYITTALEKAGFQVDFRDYQTNQFEEPFKIDNCLSFLEGSARIIGISVMANLLPFAVLLAQAIKERHPEKTVILGGVGPKSVERTLLERFPQIDVVAYGEGEASAPILLDALVRGEDLRRCPGIFYRQNGSVIRTHPQERIRNLDQIPFPAYDRVNIPEYGGIGMITSRGCPFKCTFCSVAPVWDRESYVRTPESIIEEMRFILDSKGKNLFLFQDEFFLASPYRAKEFSRKLLQSGLKVRWKAFGRVDLVDKETMELMADAGCVELRFGIESGSDEILERTRKGFTSEKAIEVVALAARIMPRVDTFFIWGFPFETMEHFYQSVFLMDCFRSMGVRVLPSLLCYLPQTDIYREIDKSRLEFSYEMIPEYMVTGHETCSGYGMKIEESYSHIYDLIVRNKDIFPGFFHYDLERNVWPKLAVLKEFGFYKEFTPHDSTESCGAHSARLATRS